MSMKADRDVVGGWLFLSYKNKGFAHYNTLRKKMIHELMGLGIEEKEYWIAIGRLKELQSLGMNIRDEFNRRKKKEERRKKRT